MLIPFRFPVPKSTQNSGNKIFLHQGEKLHISTCMPAVAKHQDRKTPTYIYIYIYQPHTANLPFALPAWKADLGIWMKTLYTEQHYQYSNTEN